MPDIISRKDAIAAGFKRYFTGKPCKNGHVSERHVWFACVECYRLHNATPERKALRLRRYLVWRKLNPDKISKTNRKMYEKTRAKRIAYAAAYRQANPDKVRAWNTASRQKRLGLPINRKEPISIVALLKRQNDRCAYCSKIVTENFHIDHIIPMTKGGSDEYNNLQVTCPTCNHRKKDKMPNSFAREIGLLI